jgi:hypothetical protein
MAVDDASALENTLLRLRQRYTLFFSLPENERGHDPRIEVALADAAGRRYAGSEVRFRRVFNNADGSNTADPVVISRTPASGRSSPPSSSDSASTGMKRRRPAVNEDGTRIENTTPAQGGGWRKADESAAAPASSQPVLTPEPAQPKADTAQQPQQGGWRRVKPGEQP